MIITIEEIGSLFLKSYQKENNKLRPFQELKIFRRQITLTLYIQIIPKHIKKKESIPTQFQEIRITNMNLNHEYV